MTGATPPIFIVGCPRSGTGLLRDLLRSHPRLTFPRESHFLPRLYRAYGDPREDGDARGLATAILQSRRVKLWGLELEPEDLQHHRSFASLVSAVYEAWCRKEGKPRWGDKTPQYVYEIPLLLEVFPDAQVIHVCRDGRDVAISLMKEPWGPANVFAAAGLWRDAVSRGRASGRRLSSRTYCEVRYEDLLTAPEPVLRRVCSFLDEPFHPATLAPSRLSEGGRTVRHQGTLDPSNHGKWRTTLTASERSVFATVAGDVLESLGYPVENAHERLLARKRLVWRAEQILRRARWVAVAPGKLDRGRIMSRAISARARRMVDRAAARRGARSHPRRSGERR